MEDIGCDLETSRTRHVLRHYCGSSRKKAPKVASDQPAVQIVPSSRPLTDVEDDRFSRIEFRCLDGTCQRRRYDCYQNRCQPEIHLVTPARRLASYFRIK